MPRLTIDTSLFEPIEIEINKTVYEAKRLTRAIFKEIGELDKKIEGGDIDAGYKLLELLLGEAAVKVISELDMSQVNKICDFIVSGVSKAGDEEKNESKSGDKDTQS